MTKTFKDQVLIEGDVVDRQGDIFPRDVLAEAVADLKDRMEKGEQLLVTEKFSGKVQDAQGIVENIWMDGATVIIDGVILDTEAGKKVQKLSDVAYALGGIGKPVKDPEKGTKIISDLKITSVSAVPDGVKVK